VATGFIALTSPPVLYEDFFTLGGRLPETLPALPGDIRAYDVRTEKMRWSFHNIPHPGEFDYDTWPKDAWQKSRAANNWTGMKVGQKTGILYAPAGLAMFDFYVVTV
jgi:quinoprotein glucose dehydrogenase